MQFKSFLFFLLICPEIVSAQGVPDLSLLPSRVLIIFSPGVNNDKYREQLLQLSKDPAGLDKNNISILEIFPTGGLEADGSTMEENKVEKFRKKFKVPDTEFRIVLLDEKEFILLESGEVADPATLFKAAGSGK